MYQSSKNKSSFRIADILHQNTTDTQLLAQHLMFKNANLSHGFGHEEMFHKGLKTFSDDNKNDKSQSSAPTSPVPENSQDQNIYKDDIPCKPSPMYSNFPLGFPMGIHPAFHPAAAYYADAMHKGKCLDYEFIISQLFCSKCYSKIALQFATIILNRILMRNQISYQISIHSVITLEYFQVNYIFDVTDNPCSSDTFRHNRSISNIYQFPK